MSTAGDGLEKPAIRPALRCRLIGTDSGADGGGDVGGCLVFPEAQDGPALCREVFGGLQVAGHVPVELGAPPVGVGLGTGGVLGAAVPEAAVEEDGDPGAAEEYVDGPPGHAGHRRVDPVAQPPAEQQPSYGQLLGGVAEAWRLIRAATAGDDAVGGTVPVWRRGPTVSRRW